MAFRYIYITFDYFIVYQERWTGFFSKLLNFNAYLKFYSVYFRRVESCDIEIVLFLFYSWNHPVLYSLIFSKIHSDHLISIFYVFSRSFMTGFQFSSQEWSNLHITHVYSESMSLIDVVHAYRWINVNFYQYIFVAHLSMFIWLDDSLECIEYQLINEPGYV